MIRAIIFDCFGVLITDAFQGIVNELREINPDKAEQISVLVRASNKGQIDPNSYRSAIADILGTTVDEHISKVNDGEIKNQQLFEYIKNLRRTYKIGLLSNVSIGGLNRRFTDKELEDHFDEVVASGDIGYAKPEAQAYEIAADRLGVRLDECIMVDDRDEYCVGAVGVGMQAIQYISLGQLKSNLGQIIKQTSQESSSS